MSPEQVCGYWRRNRAREERWDGVSVSAEELVRIRDAQVAEDKADPPCRTCNHCFLLLDNGGDEHPLPLTDYHDGDTLDEEVGEENE